MFPHFLSRLFSLFYFALLHHSSHPFSFSSTLIDHRFASWTTCPLVFICMLAESLGSHDFPTDILTLHTQRLGIIFWVFGSCFPSLHSPFTIGFHYGPSCKTTLRLRDLVFASTYFSWTGFVHWLKYGKSVDLRF